MGKSALITGISGQDGAYLAKLLLEKGYDVVGTSRSGTLASTARLEALGIHKDVEIVLMDLAEYAGTRLAIERAAPDEIYNLAAQSFVGTSFEHPLETADIGGMGPARILEALRELGAPARFFQASTSEMFGKAHEVPGNESTPFRPCSPYAAAKLFAHWLVVNYRESYGQFAASGILFNHESPLRGEAFVTRKVTLALARIALGEQERLSVGNVEAERDWGFAGDYVDGMWRMLQQSTAGDFVLATGRTVTVREFITAAASALDIHLEWQGDGRQTKAVDVKSGKVIVDVDPRFFRPIEAGTLLGDASKAGTRLGWTASVGVEELTMMMARADYDRVKSGRVTF